MTLTDKEKDISATYIGLRDEVKATNTHMLDTIHKASKLANVAADLLQSLAAKIAREATGDISYETHREWAKHRNSPSELKAALARGSYGEEAVRMVEEVAATLPKYWEQEKAAQELGRDILGYTRVTYGPNADKVKFDEMTTVRERGTREAGL